MAFGGYKVFASEEKNDRKQCLCSPKSSGLGFPGCRRGQGLGVWDKSLTLSKAPFLLCVLGMKNTGIMGCGEESMKCGFTGSLKANVPGTN